MIVGTAGHIDHGKTSLVAKLTGVDTDRLKEEKARGITIELGFAYWPQPDGSVIGFIDVPGHEKLVHTMLAGASGIDLLLLVVAADDGIMPQTREHLAIAQLLGIRHGVIALTKGDLADGERIASVTNDLANLLAGGPFENAPVVPVSSATGHGLEELSGLIRESARRLGSRRADGAFRLAVDRSFTLAGIGTVVTGTVLSGAVETGDHILVSPSGLSARIRSIHAQNRPAQAGRAGDRCALNLAGPDISKHAIRRGDMILAPYLHAPTARIDAELTVLPSETRPVTMWMPVRLHHASAETLARVVLLGEDPIAPGRSANVQLVLDAPIAAAAHDRFVLRDVSATRTLGGGRFLDLRPPERKRRSPQRLAQLAALAQSDPADALARLLGIEPGYADLTAFARDRALGANATAALSRQLGLVHIAARDYGFVFLPETWDALTASVLETLKRYHEEAPDLPGMGLERLRLAVQPRLPAAVFRAALARLAAARHVIVEGSWIRLPEHEVRLTPDDERLWTRIAPLIGDKERFRPPRVRDIGHLLGIREEDIRRLFKLVARRGDVHEVAHDHFFLRSTVGEMVRIAARLAAEHPDGFNAAQFRDQLDNGRKVAIQILEFFDRHGVTFRRGDLRRINRQRLDLFASAGDSEIGREASPVGRPDFKSGRGRQTVSGGFDSHSLPPAREKSP